MAEVPHGTDGLRRDAVASACRLRPGLTVADLHAFLARLDLAVDPRSLPADLAAAGFQIGPDGATIEPADGAPRAAPPARPDRPAPVGDGPLARPGLVVGVAAAVLFALALVGALVLPAPEGHQIEDDTPASVVAPSTPTTAPSSTVSPGTGTSQPS